MSYPSTLFRWYFSRRALPYWYILALDCLIVYVTAIIIYALNNGALHTLSHMPLVCGTFAVYLLCFMVGFRVFHTYAGIIRFSSFVDLTRVADGMLLGLALAVGLRWALNLNENLMPVRLRDLLLTTGVGMMLMWFVRVSVKWLYESIYRSHGAEKVFVYGVRRGGIALAKSIRNQDPAKWRVAGFVTDEPSMANRVLMGVNVHPNDSTLLERMQAEGATALIVSPLRGDSLREHQAMVNTLIDNGIRIFVTPKEREWDGHEPIDAEGLREVDIEDLLPRDKIEIDMQAIADQLQGACILITGAAGSIGSEIVRQVASFGPSCLVLVDQAETPLHDIRLMMRRDFPDIEAHTVVADITEQARMQTLFARHKPEYVFHAAAYKHVPMMEDNPAEAICNNVDGTRVVADLAVEYGVRKFVMVSTDKAVNPTNVMGASKRLCEIYVQSLDKAIKEGHVKGRTRFVTTRFGNVLGSNGSVIPLFKEQIRRGGPLTVTHPDIIRYFMLIPEACKLVLEAAVMGEGGEIFVFDMGEPVKIVDLARRMLALSGRPKIEIVFTGLRDGEKLYEEVLNEKETTMATPHPSILRAKVREYDFAEVATRFDELVEAARADHDDMELVGVMKQMVPEFRSQHSVYEALDAPQPSRRHAPA